MKSINTLKLQIENLILQDPRVDNIHYNTIFGPSPVYRIRPSYCFLSCKSDHTQKDLLIVVVLFMTCKYFLMVVSNLSNAILLPRWGSNLRTPICEANALPLTSQRTTRLNNIQLIGMFPEFTSSKSIQ